jgi:hypothetical protein
MIGIGCRVGLEAASELDPGVTNFPQPDKVVHYQWHACSSESRDVSGGCWYKPPSIER